MRTWLKGLVSWPVSSQRAARRNAQQAAITLAHERRHREQVEEDVDRMLDCRSSSAEDNGGV